MVERPVAPHLLRADRMLTAGSALAIAAYASYLALLRGHPVADDVGGHAIELILMFTAGTMCWLGSRRHHGQRLVWRLVSVALALWAFATLLWTVILHTGSGPSLADAVWLIGYVMLYAAIVCSLREQAVVFYVSLWLDGLIVALGISAVVAAVLWPTLQTAVSGAGLWSVVVNLGYPLVDVLMLALLGGMAVLVGGRLSRPLAFLAAGMLVTALADIVYFVQVTNGADGGGPSLLDVTWVAAQIAMALGAWQVRGDDDRRLALRGWRVIALPGALTLVALGLVAWSGFARLSAVPTLLAVATLVTAAVRAAVTFRENLALVDLRTQVRTDELTGLLNRRGFYLIADARLEAADPENTALVVLLLDLNGFKELNDTFGHQVGDALLQEVSRRLRFALPDAAVARLGGDEFVALLDVGPQERDAVEAGRQMLAALNDSFPIEGTVTHVGGSIGVARFPKDANNRTELLRAADVAMYRAKRHNTGVELYVTRIDHHSRDRVTLAGELHEALNSDQFVLHYQPKVALGTGEVIGVEALVRWAHPTRGLIYPDVFIEIAEQHGLMRRLTLRVIDLALLQQRRWRDAGTVLRVAVNVSPSNLLDDRFVNDVAELVHRRGVPPGSLQLEITENTVMLDPARALDMLARLGELGITFALDDFGTGYSSLSQLKRLPLAEIKIDKSFVLDMTDSTEDAVIVRSTVDLARNLGLHVVAEGVETQGHWDHLAGLGCDTAQGYFLSRPLPADELSQWLREEGLVDERNQLMA